MVECLLALDADANACDSSGGGGGGCGDSGGGDSDGGGSGMIRRAVGDASALHKAARRGHGRMVEILVEWGARVELRYLGFVSLTPHHMLFLVFIPRSTLDINLIGYKLDCFVILPCACALSICI